MTLILRSLYKELYGIAPEEVIPLKAHASERKIFRLIGKAATVCGIENNDVRENESFLYLAEYFSSQGIPVPKIFAISSDRTAYLEEDLGDVTLLDVVNKHRTEQKPFPGNVEELYRKVLEQLVNIQAVASKGVDYTRCFQGAGFGKESMLWDMNYFAESFLRVAGIAFDHQKLLFDFERLATFLAEAPAQYFLYRDFQSRNIMIRSNEPYFIDFQSGRQGPLQYDVASLLYQSSTKIPNDARKRLLEGYLKALTSHVQITDAEFLKYFDGFILIRMMQVLATYGKQGIVGGKEYFLNSIPFAVQTIKDTRERVPVLKDLTELNSVFDKVIAHERYGSKA